MKPLPLDQWDPSLQPVIDDMNGTPINVHSLMANHPALLNAWWRYRQYIVRGGELTQRDCELVILRVATRMRAWYEWGSHVDRGLAAGLSMEEIDRVKSSPVSSAWSESDALLLRAVDQLVDRHGIDDALQSALAKHYSRKQIMDIIAVHGVYVTIGCMVNTWGLQLDDSVQARLPAGVTRAAFEQDGLSANSD